MNRIAAKSWLQSSSIQTILSVPESNRFSTFVLADYTAGRELHPALKSIPLCVSIISDKGMGCNP